MELGPQNLNRDDLPGPNSIIVVRMDPLCYRETCTSLGLGVCALQLVARPVTTLHRAFALRTYKQGRPGSLSVKSAQLLRFRVAQA